MASSHPISPSQALLDWVGGSAYTGIINPGVNPSITTSVFPNDDFTPLLLATSLGDVSTIQLLLNSSGGVDINWQGSNSVIPQVTALHIGVRCGFTEVVKLLLMQPDIDVNRQDQWGFTPLHYAIITRNKDIVLLLTNHGCSSTIESKNGSTPLDIAEKLGYEEIVDILTSKSNLEKDPTLPKFRNWLCSLGAGEYLPKFLGAGYDLKFIAKQGLTDVDLDCVGIPMSKLGIRRKIMALHNLSSYYEEGDEDEEEEGEGDEDGEGEDGEEEEEEEA